MNTFQAILNRVTHHSDSPPRAGGQVTQGLLEAVQGDMASALQRSHTTLQGLTNADASQRLKRFGFNEVVQGRRSGLLRHATSALINPLTMGDAQSGAFADRCSSAEMTTLGSARR